MQVPSTSIYLGKAPLPVAVTTGRLTFVSRGSLLTPICHCYWEQSKPLPEILQWHSNSHIHNCCNCYITTIASTNWIWECKPHNKWRSDIRNVMVRRTPTCKLSWRMLLHMYVCRCTLISILEVTEIKEFHGISHVANVFVSDFFTGSFRLPTYCYFQIHNMSAILVVPHMSCCQGLRTWLEIATTPLRPFGRFHHSRCDATAVRTGQMVCVEAWQGSRVKLDE